MMDFSDLTDDALTGGYRVWQRRRGHRYSLDDVLTAYEALQLPGAAPPRYLDLGCGLGSVLLMLAYKLPAAQGWGIEAQPQSFELGCRNVERNGLQARLRLIHGDLRDAETVAATRPPFTLVTGTPPYRPPEAGTVSPDSQRAHARVELRGGVEAYLQAAARVVTADGWVVVCAEAGRPERVLSAAASAGLFPHRVCHAHPSPRKPPLFSVWSLRAQPAVAGLVEVAFLARDGAGRRTPAYGEVRAFFDLPAASAEAASPRLRARSQSATRGSIA